MQVNIERREGQVAVVTPEGRLDLASASEFKQALNNTVDAGYRILVVDLSKVMKLYSTVEEALVDH